MKAAGQQNLRQESHSSSGMDLSSTLPSFICLCKLSKDPRIHTVGAKIGFWLGDELAEAYLGSEGARETKREGQRVREGLATEEE